MLREETSGDNVAQCRISKMSMESDWLQAEPGSNCGDLSEYKSFEQKDADA